MKKGKNIAILKHNIVVKAFMPNDIRLSFYISPIGDINHRQQFSVDDLKDLTLISSDNFINNDLFDNYVDTDSNIYTLFDEGVLEHCLTGADLGIYDYNTISNTIEVDDTKVYSNHIEGDDYGFGYCVLAEECIYGSEQTQIVKTFKGYLDIVKDSEYSIIRRCNCLKNDISKVYIPQYYIKKYQLRNGDELLCTCKKVDEIMVLDSLFTINQEARYNFDCNRPWFKDLSISINSKKLRGNGEYTKNICNKFKMFEGDSIFVYLTRKSQKVQLLPSLVKEINTMFDTLIYINTEYSLPINMLDDCNILQFCTLSSANASEKQSTILLGAHHARRLVELGKKVAIIVDDIDSIIELDKVYNGEMPISKTLFNSIKSCENNGSNTIFILVPLRNSTIKTFKLDGFYKTRETLGVVIDNNELDLFKSYRI